MSFSVQEIKDSTLIKIENNCGLIATLCNFGAGVFSLYLDGKPLILEAETLDDYKYSFQFFGKTLGVVAGRFKSSGYLLNHEYNLLSEPGKSFSLHGGNLSSISFKNWKYKIKESSKKIDVIFNIKTKNNENGFPGGANIYVTYSFLKEKNEFKILYKASTPGEATFLNLSNHMYFNFAENNISEHKLKMNASTIAVTDENLYIYSSKEVNEVMDFNKLSKLGTRLKDIEKKDFKGTIDDTFKFDGIPGKISLSNSDVELNIQTTYPAVNIYVDNSLSNMKFKNKNLSKNRRGIAIEPQKWLLDFYSIILKTNQIYKEEIKYKFKKKVDF
ncbi:MAG: hypothetical protein J6X03_04920 [Bacilli bacterium]|nr:hypothetical protein [Bacilli bacterium]